MDTPSQQKAPTGFIGNTKNRDEMCLGWQTPPELLAPVRVYFGGEIPFDVCTTDKNPTGATAFWTPETDALKCSWPSRCFVNPPYGKAMKDWVQKAVRESCVSKSEIILLLSAARWKQGWWQQFLTSAHYVCFIRGRVSFIQPITGDRVSGNTYANMFVGLGVTRPVDWARCFSNVGLCMRWDSLNAPPEQTAYQSYRTLIKQDRK